MRQSWQSMGNPLQTAEKRGAQLLSLARFREVHKDLLFRRCVGKSPDEGPPQNQSGEHLKSFTSLDPVPHKSLWLQ